MDKSIYFEKVSKYADDADVALPIRKTQYSAGYDLAAAEDYIIPSLGRWSQKQLKFGQ